MGSPKTGPTWRDVSRSVKLKKLKTNSSRKKIRKSHTYQPKNKIFWRHLRQYLNNIVLPPLKKIKSKKISELFQSIQLHSKKTNPIICNLRKNINHLKQHQKNITKLKEENQKIKIKIINNKSWNQPV